MDDVAGGDGVGGVDFSDGEKGREWLSKKSVEICCVITSRAALRVSAKICGVNSEDFPIIALSIFRATLVSSVRGLGKHTNIDKLRSAAASARSAARAAETAATFAGLTVEFAVRSARLSADVATLSPRQEANAGASIASLSVSNSLRSVPYYAASAALKDSVRTNEIGRLTKLWQDTDLPAAVTKDHEAFLSILKTDFGIWEFWHDWYLAMWEGRFTDWDLASEVAQLPDEVWEEGAEAVAEAIRDIEKMRASDLPRPDNVPELERAKLLKYVERLLDAPEMTALAAEGTAATLQSAIGQYLDKAGANCLPDELRHLERIPKLFTGISAIVKSGGKSEAKVAELADQIEALNGQVAKLEADLKKALSKTVNGLFKQSAIKAAGAAFGTGVIGTLGMGLAHFFGGWPDDFTLENLRGFLSELETATPKTEDGNRLPPATDV